MRRVRVDYRRQNGRVLLKLTVIVPDGDDWELRARRTARLIGEIHFHLYDLEPES